MMGPGRLEHEHSALAIVTGQTTTTHTQVVVLRSGSIFIRFSSVQFSRSVVSDSLRSHELQHARPPCPSPTPTVYPNPCHRVGDPIQPTSNKQIAKINDRDVMSCCYFVLGKIKGLGSYLHCFYKITVYS